MGGKVGHRRLPASRLHLLVDVHQTPEQVVISECDGRPDDYAGVRAWRRNGVSREKDRLEILLADLWARCTPDDELLVSVKQSLKEMPADSHGVFGWPLPKRLSVVPTRFSSEHYFLD